VCYLDFFVKKEIVLQLGIQTLWNKPIDIELISIVALSCQINQNHNLKRRASNFAGPSF